jgi:hypothetical protein
MSIVSFQNHGKAIIQAIVSFITIGVAVGFIIQDYNGNGPRFVIGIGFLCFNLGLWYKGEKLHHTIAEKREKYKKFLLDTKDYKLTEQQRILNKKKRKMEEKQKKTELKLDKEREKAKLKFEAFKKKYSNLTNTKQTSSEDDFELKTLEEKFNQIDEEIESNQDEVENNEVENNEVENNEVENNEVENNEVENNEVENNEVENNEVENNEVENNEVENILSVQKDQE